MAKKTYIGVDGVARKVKKAYVGIDGTARKVKKAFIGIDGIARVCFGGVDVGALPIAYTGTIQDSKIVTMGNGKAYRLLTLTSSGVLSISTDDPIQCEVWLCGGGTSGVRYTSDYASGGGAGAFAIQSQYTITQDPITCVIGAGGARANYDNSTNFNAGGANSFGELATPNSFSRGSRGYGVSGGTGGGAGGGPGFSNDYMASIPPVSTPGTGDGKSKVPFDDTSLFSPHCAGGGAGIGSSDVNGKFKSRSGAGGTNGGNGGTCEIKCTYWAYNKDFVACEGDGGNKGGGKGFYHYSSPAENASFYGSGGGGAGSFISSNAQGSSNVSGAGYQGVIYVRIPYEQTV